MRSQFDLQQNGYIKTASRRHLDDLDDQEFTNWNRSQIPHKECRFGRILYRKRSKRWVKLGQIIDGRAQLTPYQAKKEVNRLYREILNNPSDGGPAPLAAIVALQHLPISRKPAATFVIDHLKIR